jgi:hypothetical protein
VKNHWNSTLARKEHAVRRTNAFLHPPYDLAALLAHPAAQDDGTQSPDSPAVLRLQAKRTGRISNECVIPAPGAARAAGRGGGTLQAPKRRRAGTDDDGDEDYEGPGGDGHSHDVWPDLPPGVPRVPVRDAVRMLEDLPVQTQTALLEVALLAAPAFRAANNGAAAAEQLLDVVGNATAAPPEPVIATAAAQEKSPEMAEAAALTAPDNGLAMPPPRPRTAAAAGGTPASALRASSCDRRLAPSVAGHTPLPLRHLPTELGMFNQHEGGVVAQMEKMSQDIAAQQ